MAVAEGGYHEIPFEEINASAGRLPNLPLEISKYVGYSFNNLIVSCAYGRNDKQCTEGDAILYVDPDMYNCYTLLRLNETEMQKSGPQHGLTLTLYISKYIIIQHHLTVLGQYKLLKTIVPSIDLHWKMS